MISFNAGENGNYFFGESEDVKIFAEIEVPEDASEDYGYIDLKEAVIAKLTELGISLDEISFQYDGQEKYLAEDARTGEDVYVEVSF